MCRFQASGFTPVFASICFSVLCTGGLAQGNCTEEDSDGGLLQLRKGLSGQLVATHAAWSAGVYDSCLSDCGPKRYRKVDCRAVFEDKVLPPANCVGPRPAAAEPCCCGVVVCKSAPAGGCPDSGSPAPSPNSSAITEVGCFSATCLASDPDSLEAPMLCQNWTGEGLCSCGLPFYRIKAQGMDMARCSQFCLGKGLDIFGLEEGGACRCGTSSLNWAIWHEPTPRPGLAFNPSALEPAAAGHCPLRVYRYAGYYESGQVPRELWTFREGDLEYVDSVATGKTVDELVVEGETPPASDKAPAALQEPSQQPDYLRPCYPHNCGPGNGPWPFRKTAPPAQVQDLWEEYVYINYVFEKNVGNETRAAFQRAVEMWRGPTCINLIEQAWGWTPEKGEWRYIEVGVWRPGQCSAYIGWGRWSPSWINLGYCNNSRWVGVMAHEIGHSLGMNHEQKRPDATKSFHGHGPYLKVQWDQMPAQWEPQFMPDNHTYIGSQYDGSKDPQVGYAPYDFESIMHYGKNQGDHRHYWDAIPADMNSKTGSRQHLSVGDVRHINDLYQCYPRKQYQLKKQGVCEHPITTQVECGMAAGQLGAKFDIHRVSPGPAALLGVVDDPPYCYYKNNELVFESEGRHTGTCTSTAACLCHGGASPSTPAPTPTPTPTPTPAPTPAPGRQPPGSCSFEDPAVNGAFCDTWQQNPWDTFDWTQNQGRTASYSTGPVGALDGQRYLYIETSGRRPGDRAVLQSAPLSIDSPVSLNFLYHMRGFGIGSLEVLVQRGAADIQFVVWSRSGEQGGAWLSGEVDLSSYLGSTISVSFAGTTGGNTELTSWAGDIAIDAIAFIPQLTPPPATTPPALP